MVLPWKWRSVLVNNNPGEFIASLPTKRMAAGALFRDDESRLLIVKPVYRPDWLIPGGTVDKDESPYQACVREITEELGVAFPVGRLLCVAYQSAHSQITESLQLIFDGGVLDGEQMRSICLPAGELSEYRFCAWQEAQCLLNPKLAQRLAFAWRALQEERLVYVENKAELR